jgi:hypothetical protein
MSPDPSSRPPVLAIGHLARGNPGTSGTAATPAHVEHGSRAAGENRTPPVEAAAIKEQHDCKRRRSTSPPPRRLGPIDYTLLALIVLGVAITVAMAIVDP